MRTRQCPEVAFLEVESRATRLRSIPAGQALALEPERKQRQGLVAGEALEQRYV
jgi:hypothetical protein